MSACALTIAGSDSGGGAGVQADLRVFARLGVFGTSALTAITAQNLGGVSAVRGVEPTMVRAQIDAVLAGFPVAAVKTGMLWSAAIVREVAAALAAARLPLIVDPVMVATSGARLLDDDAVDAYRTLLAPIAALITPNLDEVAALSGAPIDPAADGERLAEAAATLGQRLGCPVLLKGGHLAGDPVDVLWRPAGVVAWRHPRVTGTNTHGTGCMLSAAVAAQLALGHELEVACERALAFVHDALVRARSIGGARLAGIEEASADPLPITRVLSSPRE